MSEAAPATTNPPVLLDPARLMQGFPPPADCRVHLGNWQQWPQKIWAFQHAGELFGSRRIARGGAVRPWAVALADLDDLPVDPAHRWAQVWPATHTDALLVLHRGRIVDERYFNGMTAAQPHLIFSATKSMAGLMAATLVAEGWLEDSAPVGKVLPELAHSAWADATVRQVMDMTDGVVFTEVYDDPASDIFRYVASMGWVPQQRHCADPPGILANLATLQRRHDEPRGSAFRYRSPATDVTAWLATRAAGQSMAAWLQQRLWQPLGMEADASLMLDPQGTEVAFAGMSATARDLARLGQLMLHGGRLDGRQILPAAAVDTIAAGGSTTAFAAGGYAAMNPARSGWSYRAQWWHNPQTPRSFGAYGAFGQRLVVLPDDDLVVVLFGSHPNPMAGAVDPLHLRAFAALAHHLKDRP
jgi:CubicO group peptidase (beta-lactamase class C family)